MHSLRSLGVVAAIMAVTAACAPQVKAPFDPGVCYYVVLPDVGEEGEARFNRVADNQPQIEHCAARLEEMRVRFLRMGGSNREIMGAFQGQFIFIDRDGVWFSRTLEGGRFFALARSGDGRLAIPGAFERAPEAPAGATPNAPPAA